MIIFPLPTKIIFTNSPDPVSSPDFVLEKDKLLTVLTFNDPDDPSGLFWQHAVTRSDDRFYAIYDGYGNNTVTYQKSVLGVNIDLTRPDGEQERNGDSEVNQWDHGSGDVLVYIENITGSLFNDTLTGNNKANILDGTRGSDTLTGGYGEDIFIVDFQIGHGWDVITDFKRSVDTLILRVTEEINDMRSAFEDGVFEISKPNNHQFDVNYIDNLNDGFSIQFIDSIHEYTSLTDALGVEDIQLEFV